MAATARNKQQDGARGPESNPQVDQPQFEVAPFLGEKQRALLRKGMCAPLSEDQAEYFFEVVERMRLDPFKGEIWPSMRRSKDEHGQWQPSMFVLIKLQGFRTNGDRSGVCDGESPIQWCGPDEIWKEVWLASEPPMAARASVYRKDRSRPQTAVCLWRSYSQNVFDRQGNEVPNAIWKRMGPHMLGKCALAGAYRGAFPQQSSGVYISEEIGEGTDVESEASIEAEMTRRYAREHEYWATQRAKGIYPVGEEPHSDAETKTEPAVVKEPEPSKPEPAEVVHGIVSASTAPETAPEDKMPVTLAEAGDPRADWRTFPITRIRIFEGRTVGSLSANELRGLTPWLERVSGRWGSVDNDVKSHYRAITQRLEHDSSEKSAEALMDDELQMDLIR
jgi:RecT family